MLESRKLRMIFLLFFIFVIGSTSAGPMINNGDFWQTAQSMGVHVPAWKPLAHSYPISTPVHFRYLTMSMIVSLGYVILFAIGSHQYYVSLIFWSLNLIFFSGLYCLITEIRETMHRNIYMILYGILYAIYGFFFRSIYLEASVLAVSPWFLLGVHRLLTSNRYTIFTIASWFLIMSNVQMLFIVPIVIWILLTNTNKIKAIRLTASILIVSATVPFLLLHEYKAGLNMPNDYDRYYSGIGYAIQDAYAWPARTFNARAAYFYKHRAQLERKSIKCEPYKNESLLGTDYWPTGTQLRKESYTKEGVAVCKKMGCDNVIHKGDLKHFSEFFLDHPELMFRYLKNTFLITLRANYNISYLRTPSAEGLEYFYYISVVQRFILDSAGYLFFAIGLVAIALRPSIKTAVIVVYFFIGAPIFVVLGDGFFEFEKHMVAYFMIITIPVYLALYGGSRSVFAQSIDSSDERNVRPGS